MAEWQNWQKENKNYRQLLIEIFFEQLWKIDKKTKVVNYFERKFFFEAKISKVWLKIKFKIFRHVVGATYQH